MSDDGQTFEELSDQFFGKLRAIRVKHSARIQEALTLAAQAGCGIDETIEWVSTADGYRVDQQLTFAPDLPPYAIRHEDGQITQYALREEGDDT